MKKMVLILVTLFVLMVIYLSLRYMNNPKTPTGMVLIPGGIFFMGCVPGDGQCGNYEKPRRQIHVDAFFLDVHETTVAEYMQCVFAGVCDTPRVKNPSAYGT